MDKSKMKRRQKGFTLVEVIVVAVIVAALAAVAVPLYINYVDDSHRNTAANVAGSVASFAGACRNSGGTMELVGSPATSATCTVGEKISSSIVIPAAVLITNNPPKDGKPGSIAGIHVLSDNAVTTNTSTYNY